MARLRLQTSGILIAFLLLGSLALYTYGIASQLDQKNSRLETEVAALTSNISTLQSNIAELRNSLSLNLTSLQDSILLANSSESKDALQIAAIQAALQSYQSQLSTLTSEIKNMGTSSSVALSSIASQLENITSSMKNLKASLNSLPPMVLLRVAGTALGAFVERPDGQNYLRLMEIGGTSVVESSLASHPFNATIAGEMVVWQAVANNVAADAYHTTWPMVLENTPGGTDAFEFEDAGGIQEVAVASNGTRQTAAVSWNPTAVNTFAIRVVSPGRQVDFYINGLLVATFKSGIPKVDFLIAGAEVKGLGSATPTVATLDTYGGLLGRD
jgi:chaperonin cofactor prefoldin